MITVAIDAMGGDHGLAVTVSASLAALAANPDLQLILVGKQALIEQQLAAAATGSNQRLTLVDCDDVVAMDESPARALRQNKQSSMRRAIDLVAEHRADACVSAGNTGALMAIARHVLDTIATIQRPAIISCLPTMASHATYLLDLGANVDSSAEQLSQFATMASVLVKAVTSKQQPTVGLLNIGTEAIKGNEQVKQADAVLRQNATISYQGYVEGDDIYKGKVDIVVCDGFVGNVIIKSSEGLALLIKQLVQQAFKKNYLTRLAGCLFVPVLKQLGKQIDPDEYNGASLLGLQGVVIKSHGAANQRAFAHAIEYALQQAKLAIPTKISAQFNTHGEV